MNFAAPSAMPGPAKEKEDAARATAATFVAIERIFFITTSLMCYGRLTNTGLI
jgi:hypothetical protein